jgi:phosphoribosylformylglycinamidine cyclo-ligase
LNCPQEVIQALIEGSEEFIQKLNDLGVAVHSGGGETADVGDLTGTVTVDTTAVAVMNRLDVINGERIEPGLKIVGLSSTGKATYEDEENSGISSNGITNARHDLLAGYYRRYPETFNASMPDDLVYTGHHRFMERWTPNNIGNEVFSPTRTYAPVIQKLLRENPDIIHAIFHCTGGGQTKCLNFGENIHYEKAFMFGIPPVFKRIQDASGDPWHEMYKVFNMGHRMEVLCKSEDVDIVFAAADAFHIAAKVIGHTEKTHMVSGKGNTLTIHGPVDAHRYRKP